MKNLKKFEIYITSATGSSPILDTSDAKWLEELNNLESAWANKFREQGCILYNNRETGNIYLCKMIKIFNSVCDCQQIKKERNKPILSLNIH